MICPNCGKNVAQNAEICPFCKHPTQFSSKMKYYPRSTPLTANPSNQTIPAKPTQIHQPTQGNAELKEVLAKLGDIPKKKEMRSNTVRIIIAVGITGVLCIALLFGCVGFLSSKIRSIQSYTDSSLSRIENKVNDFASSISEIQTAISHGTEDQNEKADSLYDVIETDSILVTLYCNYPDSADKSPVCFVVKKGTDISLPTLSSVSHLFLGWQERNNNELISTSEIYHCDGDKTIELFACWETVVTPSPEPLPELTPEPASTQEDSQERSRYPDFIFGKTSEPTADPSGNYGD